ncbi:MAG: AAA domain-containing protein, partial [Chloroflexi bacterium]|nr:AAA domain-containing protein [Chloroflexota bacterium]
LAYSIMGIKDKSRVMMVQFHQSYSYEDFIMGFRPTENGFELKRGTFYNFCKDAEIDSDNAYFFIIDEINRGNLSKILGELFMLLENDKRGIKLQLLYSDEKFSVPENIYIIGTMNTADRSLALIDYALRRRFSFFTMKPAFENAMFRQYLSELKNPNLDSLVRQVQELNKEIVQDTSLGEGFCIGHSYFCGYDACGNDLVKQIIEYDLLPILAEYWYDEPGEAEKWTKTLRNVLKVLSG